MIDKSQFDEVFFWKTRKGTIFAWVLPVFVTIIFFLIRNNISLNQQFYIFLPLFVVSLLFLFYLYYIAANKIFCAYNKQEIYIDKYGFIPYAEIINIEYEKITYRVMGQGHRMDFIVLTLMNPAKFQPVSKAARYCSYLLPIMGLDSDKIYLLTDYIPYKPDIFIKKLKMYMAKEKI